MATKVITVCNTCEEPASNEVLIKAPGVRYPAILCDEHLKEMTTFVTKMLHFERKEAVGVRAGVLRKNLIEELEDMFVG